MPGATADPSRRSFLAAVAGLAASRFLPATDARDWGIPASADPAEVDRVRRLLTPVNDFTLGRSRHLMWAEHRPDGTGAGMMAWHPETPDEIAAADRLVAAASHRPWANAAELRTLLAHPGPWLVRVRLLEHYLFLSTADEAAIGRDDSTPLTPDPAEAVRLDPARAERLVLRVCEAFDLDEGGGMVVEPVDAARPWADGRFRHLARPSDPV